MLKNISQKNLKKVKKLSKKQEKQAKIAEFKKLYLKNKKTRRLIVHWNVIYHININFLRSNLFMNLQELQGRNIWWTSSGLLGFKGRKKNKYDGVLGHVIKFMRRISFIGNIYPFAIWKGVPRRRFRTIYKAFVYAHKNFPLMNWLGSIAYIYIPFNGCRRRKLKRR